MRSQGGGHAPAYNVQTAVDAEHALVVAHDVTAEANELFDRTVFVHDPKTNTLRCPAGQILYRKQQNRKNREAMRLRRSTVEHPFATLKYRIFGHPRFLLRGRRGAQTEMSLAVLAYNLKRMINILGGGDLAARLATP